MKHLGSLMILSSIYLLTLLLGMQAATVMFPLMYPPPGEEQVIQPIVSNPQSPYASAQLFVYILIMTGVLLVLMRLGLGIIIRILLSFSIITGIILSTTLLFDWLGLILAAILILLYILRRKDYNVVNIALVFTIAGIGAILGSSLSIIPALILVVIISVYDYISVYITKHMVAIAENAKGTMPLMFLIPIGDKELGLGTGDIAIPLTVCVSILKDYGVGYAIPTALGGLMGLMALFFYVEQKKEHAAMPALPPITAGLLLALGLCFLILGF